MTPLDLIEMVAIPGGTFTMGSHESEPGRFPDEGPQHKVTISPFFMGKYPVTQGQWRIVATLPKVQGDLDPNPSYFKGDLDPSSSYFNAFCFKGGDLPVEQVSWPDAVEFCARLSQATGRNYRLPTEAEWEYACRAGTTTPFYFGGTISPELANYQECSQQTSRVGSFPANAFGLHDMCGNVLEWCQDHWHDTYKGAPTNGSAWLLDDALKGSILWAFRVCRGGSLISSTRFCRSASRRVGYDRDLVYNVGFRVACDV